MDKCSKQDSLCFIYFTNGPIDSKKNMKHVQKIKRAKIEAKKMGSTAKFGHVDGLCQHELASEFGYKEESLPHLAVFYGRRNRGITLSGELTPNSVSEFLEAVTSGNVITREIGDIRVIERDCKKYNPPKTPESKKS